MVCTELRCIGSGRVWLRWVKGGFELSEENAKVYIHPGEPGRIAEYLIGEPPTEEEGLLYRRALESLGASLDPRQEKAWQLMRKSRFVMSVFDAGLALTDPSNTIRQRIFVMLSILEASPSHTRHFLPEPFGARRLAGILLRMTVSALRSVAGFILTTIYRV